MKQNVNRGKKTYLFTSPHGSNFPCSWVAVSRKYLLNRFLYDTTLALISSGTVRDTLGRATVATGRLCGELLIWGPLLMELRVEECSSVDADKEGFGSLVLYQDSWLSGCLYSKAKNHRTLLAQRKKRQKHMNKITKCRLRWSQTVMVLVTVCHLSF